MKPVIGGQFSRKIKTRDELAAVIGPFPREQRVVMCHGTFDIVHPGHIRHLVYAQDKGDTLVVSLTCDAHVSKANYRPHIPEDLRAMNLAALEIVDYVVIDRNATPLENLRFLRPDVYVKGYEYTASGLNPKTREEKEIVEAYGGEVIFSPGDIVYSSSSIIESDTPDIAVEKLLLLMEAEGIGFSDVRAALDAVKGHKVHVVGDTIIDSLTQTNLNGVSGKTPTFSCRYESRTDYVGGAGIVAKHLCAAGADVEFTTVMGDDDLKDAAVADLKDFGVKVDAVVDPTRPTTNKNAFVAGGYRLLKVDTLDNRAISDRILARFADRIASTPCETIVFSDFRHGIFNPQTIPTLAGAIPGGIFRVGDSQVASRWGNILDFREFDMITPNEREARFALGDQDSVVRPLGSELYRQSGCKFLFLKMGARGLMTFRGDVESSVERQEFFVVDSLAQNVVDPVGSGDALLAYALLSLRATDNPVIASILGSLAAAVECEHDGNVPVEPDRVRAKLDVIERRATYDQ